MNVKGLVLVLTVMLKVISVECVCTDYITCLNLFFSDFFNETDKSPPLESVIAQNSESSHVDIDTKDLDQIIQDVSGFLKEELEEQSSKDLESMLLQKVHNQTVIYVKTFDISDKYFENSGEFEKEETSTKSDDQLTEKLTANSGLVNLNISIKNKTLTSTISEKISDFTPFANNFTEKYSTPSIITTESLKKNITKDERDNEIETEEDSYLYYDNDDDNSTDYPILDYIEYYKDTTNEYINLEPTIIPDEKDNLSSDLNAPLRNIINRTLHNRTEDYASQVKDVFPWIATIFVKDSTSDQFNYYCDGALVSHTAVVTTASCVHANGTAAKAQDLIVLFGKTSLNIMTDNERVARIKDIEVHENFTERNHGNDIAIVILEEAAEFEEGIQAATIGAGEHKEDLIATTGWATTGELTPILLTPTEPAACGEDAKSQDTVCAVYGNDITVCPSYGALYVTKQDNWRLRGIRTGDPEDRGLCFNKNIAFTSLNSHWDWIKDHIE